jgi:hypothetical protein
MSVWIPSLWPWLVFFAACTIFFHWVFIRAWPLREIGWRVVDYFWLGLSVASIVGAASQWRSRVVAPELDQHRIAFHTQVMILIEATEGMRVAMCQGTQTADAAGCAWLDATVNAMKDADETAPKWLALVPAGTAGLRGDFGQEADVIRQTVESVKSEAASSLSDLTARLRRR